MRKWAQATQRSTWPPNAAVRQRSIADMTFSWPRLTWPAWDARQAGPRWRKMSATSTAGRDNGRASAGHLPQEVERAGHLADRVERYAGVERRRVELLVSEQNLDDADIGFLLQEVGGKAVPQRMNADALGDAGTPRCQANDPMQLARTRMLPAVAGKQPGLTGRHPSLFARNAPPFAQYLEKDGRENDIPILFALALFDPDDHPVTIDIGELERHDLRGSQAGGISQAQDRLVLDVYRRSEQPTDLFRAENNGQAARLAGRDEFLGKIVALQRDLEEEPQGSGTDVDGRYRRPDRRQPQLIAMNILGGSLVGRTAQKIGKSFDVADIVELGLEAKPADRHVLDQLPA